jgi:hypothetical protein
MDSDSELDTNQSATKPTPSSGWNASRSATPLSSEHQDPKLSGHSLRDLLHDDEEFDNLYSSLTHTTNALNETNAKQKAKESTQTSYGRQKEKEQGQALGHWRNTVAQMSNMSFVACWSTMGR